MCLPRSHYALIFGPQRVKPILLRIYFTLRAQKSINQAKYVVSDSFMKKLLILLKKNAVKGLEGVVIRLQSSNEHELLVALHSHTRGDI